MMGVSCRYKEPSAGRIMPLKSLQQEVSSRYQSRQQGRRYRSTFGQLSRYKSLQQGVLSPHNHWIIL